MSNVEVIVNKEGLQRLSEYLKRNNNGAMVVPDLKGVKRYLKLNPPQKGAMSNNPAQPPAFTVQEA